MASLLRDGCGLLGVGVLVRHDGVFELEAFAGPDESWRGRRPGARAVRQALSAAVTGLPTAENGASADGVRVTPVEAARATRRGSSDTSGSLIGTAVPISTGVDDPWGMLAVVGDERLPIAQADLDLLAAAAAELGVAVSRSHLLAGLSRQLRKSDALLTIAADISSKLDLGQILSGLLDYTMVLFGADRAAVYLLQPDGRFRADAVRNLSEAYLDTVSRMEPPLLEAQAIDQERLLFRVGYGNDPRAEGFHDQILAEGYDTVCVAPLRDVGGGLGLLAVYHDQPHVWATEDVETIEALSTQASMAIRTAQNFAQMATWAAQLQSIQHLGARLSRLKTVQEIGAAIASELRQLIEYHNIRVYRVAEGRRLHAVALQGRALEYLRETPELVSVGWGEGITGWVAEHGVAQYLPDAAADPRTETIPGTSEDVDESILAAPMTYEGRVLGVLVLSKLGLHQFGDDELRLLRIYASFAAQAMANADATERLRAQASELERQLRSQRELLQITESILSTLDARVIVEQITDRLYEIVRYDAVTVELGDRAVATPIAVADRQIREAPCDDGPDAPAPEPSVIEVPLRGRGRVTGMLRLTRYGDEPAFTGAEIELVRLFAAHVSIALQNAEVHAEVEMRAQSDDLTGLLGRGAMAEQLKRFVDEGEQFSLIMLDLDDFKRVNDRMGHQAGDVFLQQIATAIVGAARDTDVVFRYGGDEFAVLLPRTNPHGARLMAERVQEALHGVRIGRRSRDPRPADRRKPEVSASIGIATFPDDGATPHEVLLAADRASYAAKRSGRNRIATALDGLALAEEFTLQEPTPVDLPSVRSQ